MTDYTDHQKEILTFLLSKPDEQSKLFREIIYKNLDRMKEYNNKSAENEELYRY